MSDSSDSEVNVEIPYSKRPEWNDVKPIPQDIDTNDIVRIAYTDTFKEVFDYFRAILKANEKSKRAYELCRDAALLNPANYTVWYYRRLLIKELSLDLNEELEFITNVIRSHPKNYQVWQHRKTIVEYLQNPSQELSFTESIIRRDSKNYHAWQYRQWVIKKFGLWENELAYVDSLLRVDIRNNSAWNQRYFYLSNRHNLSSNESNAALNEEVDFTLKKIDECIDNESSWNYLRALVSHLNNIGNNESSSSFYPTKVVEFCEKKMQGEKEDDKSPFLIAFVVDYNMVNAKEMVEQLKSKPVEETLGETRGKVKVLVKTSIEMLESLATKYDTIRVNYWNYLISKWQQQFADFI